MLAKCVVCRYFILTYYFFNFLCRSKFFENKKNKIATKVYLGYFSMKIALFETDTYHTKETNKFKAYLSNL